MATPEGIQDAMLAHLLKVIRAQTPVIKVRPTSSRKSWNSWLQNIREWMQASNHQAQVVLEVQVTHHREARVAVEVSGKLVLVIREDAAISIDTVAVALNHLAWKSDRDATQEVVHPANRGQGLREGREADPLQGDWEVDLHRLWGREVDLPHAGKEAGHRLVIDTGMRDAVDF